MEKSPKHDANDSEQSSVRRHTRKLIAEIPEDLFKALKIRAVETDTLMRDLVAEALRQFLGTRESTAKQKK